MLQDRKALGWWVAIALLFAGGPGLAATLRSDEVFSSILVEPVSSPKVVTGADDRIHIVYELLVVNQASTLVALDSVEALDPSGALLTTLKGEALEKLVRVNGGGKGATLGPGISAFVVMDIALKKDSAIPDRLKNRIGITRLAPGADGGPPVPIEAGGALPPHDVFVGSEIPVDRRPAVVLAPPLRGPGWLVFNGCCDALTFHRGAILPVNGSDYVAERFAIDFVQLDAKGRLFTGPVDQLSSYPYFGVPVHAVAEGTVVNLDDGLPEEIPGKVPASSSPRTAAGNFVIVDIGGGRFAFYAHLQPGSLRVKIGQQVKTGDLIGLLGNTGNTTAPHLHFHVSDRPSPLVADGLPYEFTAFVGEGVLNDVDDDAFFTAGQPANMDRTALAGPHANQLPINNEIISFGR